MSKIWKLFTNKGSAASYALLTAIFTVVPEDYFKLIIFNDKWSDSTSILLNRLIVCVVAFSISNIGYAIYRKHRKKVSIIGSNFTIQIEYGDLFKVTSGKVVIDFDECYTTKVGGAPGDIKPESVCGQYLKKHPISNIQGLIEKTEVKSAKGKSEYKGQTRYTPGTVIPNGDFLLMAFAKLDRDGLGHLTYEDYIECLNVLWQQIDMYHGTSDVYMPILGSKITRFDKELTQQELLDIIINSYRLSSKKLREPYRLHIVCREREGFSLNDVYGVE